MDEHVKEKIEQQQDYDDLTGLLNLRGILRFVQEDSTNVVSEYPVIIYINVMNFKLFNQQYGFAGGNVFLKGVATEIQGIFSNETIARTNGDQFIILAKTMDEHTILEKFLILQEACHKYEKGLKMRLKAGIYMSQGDESDPVILIDRAKIACDDIIKVYDKNYNFYDDELKKKNELRQYVIDNFESAFKNRYFKVYYQKEVRALTGKVCGYEALARWIDPVYGMISPAIFVEVLEEVHLVHKLDLYIIEQVCQDLRSDIEYGIAVLPVSVNLSRLDFELCDIKKHIDYCRDKYKIPEYLLNIEITESAVASGENFLGEQIRRFRESGYQVWMDDFGSGYSSLNNLKIYDFDVLKIDMNFLRSFDTNKRTQVILATIVNMAKELGMHTLAEGVETKEQYEFLRRIGCEKLQGYLFGKPKPLEDFVRPDDFSFDNCEDIRFKKYYRYIGDINLLGSTPLRPKTMEVYNNLPIAIYEMDNNELSLLYANNAYIEFLHTIGINTIDDAMNRCVNGDLPELIATVDGFKKAEKSPDHRSEVDMTINGNVVNCKIRFIYRQDEKAAYALVPRNLSISGDQQLADNISVAMAHLFNQYFRVDLYDENGTVVNIYLNGDQLAVANEDMDAVEAVRIYSDMYLYPEERERFRKFYDITTVRERVKKSPTEYVVDYYHSAIPGDGGRMQMYMILPFYYNNKWKYISCCRYADEIKDEYWAPQREY